MSPSRSHRGNIRYRYYRCRSHAGGRAPCVGVCLPAEEIERVVYHVLASPNVDPDAVDAANFAALAPAWGALSDLKRRRLLPLILERAQFDPQQETLCLKIVPDAAEVLTRHIAVRKLLPASDLG